MALRSVVTVSALMCGNTACASSDDPFAPTAPPEGTQTPVEFILLRGEFHDVATNGSGAAEVVRTTDGSLVLRFTDFQTASGPVLEVYMVAAADTNDDQSVLTAGFISLGELQSTSGDQMYELPSDIDLDIFRSVTIWCVTFNVNFATAPLTPFGT